MNFALLGLLAGAMHVLSGPDHLAAVAPYAAVQRWRAWRVGVQWGLGHTSGVILVGILALLLRSVLSVEILSFYSERLVGVMLIAIGVWGLWKTRAGVAASEHPEGSEEPEPSSPHIHTALGVGTLHGLAGSSHFLGVLPMLGAPNTLLAGVYIVAFGVGTVAAMAGFAGLLGLLAGRMGQVTMQLTRGLLATLALVAIGVGICWLLGVEVPWFTLEPHLKSAGP